jgi:hypothetical protein
MGNFSSTRRTLLIVQNRLQRDFAPFELGAHSLCKPAVSAAGTASQMQSASPSFTIDTRREIARVTARVDASANMGGLTNNPLFWQLEKVLMIL